MHPSCQTLGVMTSIVTYRLSLDLHRVRAVQQATLNTEASGLQPTHGLFGSQDWWNNISMGLHPIHTVRGRISKVYMAGMNDWPEFKMTLADGTEIARTREAQSAELDKAYKINAIVEVDYVVERFKQKAWGGPSENHCVIEIRVIPSNAPNDA